MENKINELLQKCIKNNLNFSYNANTKAINITKFDEDSELIFDVYGYFELDDDVLNVLHASVDEYLEVKTYE